MKKLFAVAPAFFISSICFSQKEINIDSAQDHVGEIVKIFSKIYGAKFLENTKGTPTLLDFGAHYPDQKLTLLIWGDKRKNFKEAPETYFINKNVWVTGKIVLYKGKPEITVNDEDQTEAQ